MGSTPIRCTTVGLYVCFQCQNNIASVLLSNVSEFFFFGSLLYFAVKKKTETAMIEFVALFIIVYAVFTGIDYAITIARKVYYAIKDYLTGY